MPGAGPIFSSDADGNGSGATAIQFAGVAEGTELTASEFHVT